MSAKNAIQIQSVSSDQPDDLRTDTSDHSDHQLQRPINVQQQDEGCNRRKVALITGSATGIGARLAVDLAVAGYFVIVTGRNSDSLERIVQECNRVSNSQAATSSSSFVADLFDIKQVDKLIEFVRRKFNRLDVLVNNACWRGDIKNILDVGSVDDLKKVMHLNVSVPLYLIQKCLIPLRTTEIGAVVVNVSSVASQVAVPLHLYSISKACLSELTRQIASLSRSLDILAVTVSPGPVLTCERPHHVMMSHLTLMNRVGSVEEISNSILFVIENAVLFNGKELIVDGGYLAKQRQ